jgi:hypothetical protein
MTQQPADFDRETFHNVQRYDAIGDAYTMELQATHRRKI